MNVIIGETHTNQKLTHRSKKAKDIGENAKIYQ